MNYEPEFNKSGNLLSEATRVERGMLIYKKQNLYRYEMCKKCHNVLIKIDAKGYKQGHQSIPLGFYCRNCNKFYVNIKIQDKIEWIGFE